MQPFTFFISYRRKYTAPIALLLKYEIEKRIKFVRVAVDVEDIIVADEFPVRLKNMVNEAHATIVIIGKEWMQEDVKKTDWVEEELKYSKERFSEQFIKDRYELTERKIIPIFVDCPGDFSQFELPVSIAYLKNIDIEHIDYGNWPRYIGSLIDGIRMALNLKERTDKINYPLPDPNKAKTQAAEDEELAKILAYDDFDGWQIDNFGSLGERYLVKKFEFSGSFNKAMAFMEMVSNYCRVIDHHPDWRNVYDTVIVSLSTWDAKNKITIFDLNLALYLNKAAEGINTKN